MFITCMVNKMIYIYIDIYIQCIYIIYIIYIYRMDNLHQLTMFLFAKIPVFSRATSPQARSDRFEKLTLLVISTWDLEKFLDVIWM